MMPEKQGGESPNHVYFKQKNGKNDQWSVVF